MDHTVFIRHRNGPILSLQSAVFQVQEGHAILDLRQGLQIRSDHTRMFCHSPLPPADNGHKPKAVGLAPPNAVGEQGTEPPGIRHL